MKHLNYYIALFIIGAFALLSVLDMGHLLIFGGHLLVAGVLFVQVMAYLWILFLIVILGLYVAGILLVEIARDRRGASPAEA